MKILLTGATGKIGQVIARRLIEARADLVLHYHSSPPPDGRFVFQADFFRVSEVQRLVSAASIALGGLDVMIHAASIFERKPWNEVREADWDRMLAVDLRAAFFLAQAAAEQMKERGGKMIFFSDAAATDPYPSYLPYCVAKAGVDSLAKGLAKVVAPNITVHVIAPRGRNEQTEKIAEDVARIINVHHL